MKKRMAMFLVLVMALSLTTGFVPSLAKKTVKRSCEVLNGSFRILPKSETIGVKYKVKVVNTKKVSAKKIKPAYGGGVKVTGKKTGTTKVKVITDKKTYVYTVKVLDAVATEEKAKAALDKKLLKLTDATKTAFADLNGDAITDLFVDGDLYAYNYYSGKIRKRSTGIVKTALDSLYVSKKTSQIYMEAASGSALSVIEPDAEEEEIDYYTGDEIGIFYKFADFSRSMSSFLEADEVVSILRYAHPEAFVYEEDYLKGGDFFCFHDSHYDQDDYWYEYFSADQIPEKVAKRMPDKVQIPLVEPTVG